MKSTVSLWSKLRLCAAILACVQVAAAAAESEAMPKPSSFAPAKDLSSQADFYIGRLGESLASKADYDEAKQSRAKKDASTVAAITLVLGMHDEPSPLKAASAAVIRASQKLADSADNYDRAAQALADLKAALGDKNVQPGDLKWEKVTSLSALMKQVPVINNALKRGVEGTRFSRQIEQSAGQSATLAAIAQASIFDDSEIKDPADTPQWQKFCADMRDAAGAVNAAVHAGDQAAAGTAIKRMARSCDACHEVFRKE